MKTVCHKSARSGIWRLIVLAPALAACLGCGWLPGPLRTLSGPIGAGGEQRALRRQVEADSFPTAKQAGL